MVSGVAFRNCNAAVCQARQRRVDRNTLIGVQNGVMPNRLLKISLSDDGAAVTGASVLVQNGELLHDPTHGVLVGRDLYFIANGGFGAFGDDGKPAEGEKIVAPVIMRVGRVR